MGWTDRWTLLAANLMPHEPTALRLVERFLERIPIAEPRTVIHHEPWPLVELRGRVSGTPARVTVHSDSFHPVEVEVQCESAIGFSLNNDKTKQPFRKGPPDPDWDDTRKERIFVGPAIFVEADHAPDEIERFQLLPAELRARVIDEMIRDDVRYLRLHSSHVFAMTWSSPTGMRGPAAAIVRILELSAEIAASAALIRAPKGRPTPSRRPIREMGVLRCKYCGALCTNDVRCFHCGAPY